MRSGRYRDADAQRAGEPLSEEQSEKLAQGIWWKNTQENFAHFGVSQEGSAGLERLEGMIRKIADVLSADVDLQSEVGVGTTVSLLVPAEPAQSTRRVAGRA